MKVATITYQDEEENARTIKNKKTFLQKKIPTKQCAENTLIIKHPFYHL